MKQFRIILTALFALAVFVVNGDDKKPDFNPDEIDTYNGKVMEDSNIPGMGIVYPQARQEPFDTLLFGTRLSDPFFWMSRSANQNEMEAFARAQDSLFRRTIAQIPGDSLLEQEMMSFWEKYPEEGGYYNLQVKGEYAYFIGFDADGPGLFREPVHGGEMQRIMGGMHIINGRVWGVRGLTMAHEKPWIALMLVEMGDANPHIRIWNYQEQSFLPDSLGRVMFNSGAGVSMAWMPGDNGLLYSKTPTAQQGIEREFNGQILLHQIGKDPSEDVAIFGRGVIPSIPMEPFETPFISSFPNSDYIMVYVNHGLEEPYAWYVNSKLIDGSNTPWMRVPGKVRSLSIDDSHLYVITPDNNNYVLKRLDLSGKNPMQTLMDGQPLPLDINRRVLVTGQYAIVAGRAVGDMCLYRVKTDGSGYEKIALPHKGSIADLYKINDKEVFISTFSATQAPKPWILDVETGTYRPFRESFQSPDFSDILETKVIEVPSRDGVMIPVSLVYKKGTNLKNQNRVWLRVYASAGLSRDISPRLDLWPWYERDGVYAWAHTRGGGEKGEDWDRNGSIPYVENRINDFIDVSKYLIKENYTTANLLVIDGSSGGTYTIGTAVNLHPELFAGAFFQVGFPDAVTVLEWDIAAYRHSGRSEGVPLDAESFKHTLAISSLYNIPNGKKLPAMLITNGATDYATPLHFGTRYVAALQNAQSGNRPIFQAVGWELGHSQIVSSSDMIRFALWQTGHKDFQPIE